MRSLTRSTPSLTHSSPHLPTLSPSLAHYSCVSVCVGKVVGLT